MIGHIRVEGAQHIVLIILDVQVNQPIQLSVTKRSFS